MRKSSQVPARYLLAATASMVALGCGPEVTEVRRCVDQNGFILPDSYCDSAYGYGSYGSSYYFYSGHRIFGRPSYVYGGGGSFSSGGYATGFRRTPIDGARITTSSGTTVGHASGGVVSRGGFSGSGGSFGG